MKQLTTRRGRFALMLVSFTLIHVAASGSDKPTGGDRHQQRSIASRRFDFTYPGRLDALPPGKTLRCWFPVLTATAVQRVSLLESQIPRRLQIAREDVYRNSIGFFEATVPDSGTVSFSMTYDITRDEVKAFSQGGEALIADESARLLLPDRKVPVSGRPLELVADLALPTEPLKLGRLLYDRVEDHMKYDKSRPGYGTGDSVWACDSRYGNCTDFHSLFISLARANGLPARFEIGFPLPDERGEGSIGGYHCWAYFHTKEHGWVPTDISEADKHPELKNYYFGNLTENRVAFSTGRDITLVPKQAGEPLNYCVYPYAEMDEGPVDPKHLTKSFSYHDRQASKEQ